MSVEDRAFAGRDVESQCWRAPSSGHPSIAYAYDSQTVVFGDVTARQVDRLCFAYAKTHILPISARLVLANMTPSQP